LKSRARIQTRANANTCECAYFAAGAAVAFATAALLRVDNKDANDVDCLWTCLAAKPRRSTVIPNKTACVDIS
jgi:hypothetical protein